MPVVCCAAPPAAIRQEKRSMRMEYVRRSGGEFAETSKADKAAARKAADAKATRKMVPKACWGMFKAFLEEKPGEFDKKEPTLADLIQRILEGAGCEIDTTNWVAYHVSLHLVVV